MLLLPTHQQYCFRSCHTRGVYQLLHGYLGVTCSKRSRYQHDSTPQIQRLQVIPRSSRQAQQAARSSAGSPVQFLQAVELAAISVAAAYQAVVLINAATQHFHKQQQQQQQDAAEAELAAAAPTYQCQQLLQQQHAQSIPLQEAVTTAVQPTAAPSFGTQLQNVALLLALMCGIALRYLQRPRLPTGNPSADAAARLVAVEIISQQQAAQLTTMARQLDKLQARVRLATSDLKVPLRQAQGSASQAAAALAKLAEQQQQLQKQLDGSQELIAALQGLAAKQFKVSAEAFQQLKANQSRLSSSTSTALAEVKKQQQALQQQLEQQQKQLAALQQLQGGSRQEHQQLEGLAVSHSGTSSSGSSSSFVGQMPDPWGRTDKSVQYNGASNGVISS